MKSLLLSLGASILCAPSFAQPKWIPLVSGVPDGASAQITFNADTSDEQRSVFDVRIFGFWREDVVGPDGATYQRLAFPGLDFVGKAGAPELPVARVRLGVATDAKSVDLKKVIVTSSVKLPGLLVYPQPELGSDEAFDPTADPGEGDTKGYDDKFVKNDAIYSQAQEFPSQDALASVPVTSLFDAVAGGDCECYPVDWNPTTKELGVGTHVTYEFEHLGVPAKTPALTKNLGKIASQLHLNASVLLPWWIIDNVQYHSRYLLVTAPEFEDELLPFILLKKKQGFQVSIAPLAGGENWLQILAKIGTWYLEGKPGMEEYCLLVGDTNRIPLAVLANGVPTDDAYGSPLDLDASEEVFVGRLSFDDASDLAKQVAKIVAYQTTPVGGGHYERALLVAHEQGAPGKYQGAHEVVRTATYNYPPTFLTRYGAQGATNAQVRADIDAGVGLVCYRGHGSTNAWSGWNTSGQNFHKNEILALSNAVHPVVWSIACTNHNIATNNGGSVDCIGETWLEEEGIGAVASYAATKTTGTTANHELDRRLFQALYHFGETTHAHTIFFGEALMVQKYPQTNNAWAYNLLGDPSMKIRTKQPAAVIVTLPSKLVTCVGCSNTLTVELKSPNGSAQGMLVSLWKPGLYGQDEAFVNAYADANGKVQIQFAAASPGPLYVTVQDDFGNLVERVVDIDIPCGTQASNLAYGTGKAGQLGVPVLKALDLPILGQPTSIAIQNARPGAVPTLVLGVQQVSLPFDGGVLLASPNFVLSVGVPIPANGTLTIGGVIPNDPLLCGFPLYHQALIPDVAAGGYYQLAMTNGLVRVFGAP